MPVDALAVAEIPLSTRDLVLIGVESSGKSTLFRALTGETTGDEANYRGSTVMCRIGRTRGRDDLQVVDTPGLQNQDDSVTSRLALAALDRADVVVLVVRGSDASSDLACLQETIGPYMTGRMAIVLVTFRDRAPDGLGAWIFRLGHHTGLPVEIVDARNMTEHDVRDVQAAIPNARPFVPVPREALPPLPDSPRPRTALERRRLGPILAGLLFVALFALPVYAAYQVAKALQPSLDQRFIEPLRSTLAPVAEHDPALHALLAGDYGLLTPGVYSFLWAFPVVLFIGIAMAFTDETGLRDRMALALDPWMRRLGLSGRDLIPVLGGFGCNVVAVMQSRTCTRAHRRACVSLIGFGSSCSYQIGATISVLAAAGKPWLFLPFTTIVFLVGLIHTRLGLLGAPRRSLALALPPTWLQAPSLRGITWRVRAVCKQFLWQAIPIFLVLCAVSALLAHFGVLDVIWRMSAPAFEVLFGLPGDVTPAVVFSLLRKDGLLLLNAGEGTLAASLSAGQIFLTAYLAATVAPCLVTLFTVAREMGGRIALSIGGRQFATSLVSAMALALIFRLS